MKRILGEALLTKVQDPRVGFVSVLAVKVSPEFDTAKVFVSVLGNEEEREESLVGLRSAAPFLQSQIGRAMRIRRIPKLRFIYDDSLDRSFRIDEVLREDRAQRRAANGEASESASADPDEASAAGEDAGGSPSE